MKAGRMIFWLLLIVIVLSIILILGTQDISVKASPPFLKNLGTALHLDDTQTVYLPWVVKGDDTQPIQQP